MSQAAVAWALDAKVRRASEKLVLMVLAHCANTEGLAFPSRARIQRWTELDPRTIADAIAHLLTVGHISDTGRRVGETHRIAVYRVNAGNPAGIKQMQKRRDSTPADSPKTGSNPADKSAGQNLKPLNQEQEARGRAGAPEGAAAPRSNGPEDAARETFTPAERPGGFRSVAELCESVGVKIAARREGPR